MFQQVNDRIWREVSMSVQCKYKFKTFWGLFLILGSLMIMFGYFVPFPYSITVMIFPIPFTILVMKLSRTKTKFGEGKQDE